jgi:Leucine-rich repeat (LRR) protein
MWDQNALEVLVLAATGSQRYRLGLLSDLRMLYLGHNQLTTLPNSIGDLVGLIDYLYLHDNRLRSPPLSIGQLGETAVSENQ